MYDIVSIINMKNQSKGNFVNLYRVVYVMLLLKKIGVHFGVQRKKAL